MINAALASGVPERISRLTELAHNVWWSWHPEARALFRSLEYTLWSNSGHNPVRLLLNLPAERLTRAAADSSFLALYDSVVQAFDRDMRAEGSWFSSQHPGLRSAPIAYFSMEFAVHNSLPIYAGGLGILAGDICKEASDLGLPFIGVGFMYPQGYFLQRVSPDGWQQEVYQVFNFDEAPISQVIVRGQRALANVRLADRDIAIGAWLVKVGATDLYLLDTNLPENSPPDRELSARLYTADAETRVRQEIVLGVGGVRVLHELGIRPGVWHANEGHSAFMALERIRLDVEQGTPFETAFDRVRASTIFTTHTPVSSGHDCFLPGLMEKYFSLYWPALKIDRERFFRLGQADGGGQPCYNMTALALNTSARANAVSGLHEGVTRKMWNSLWPDKPEADVPITHVTNGVHVPAWLSDEMRELFEKYLGRDCLKEQGDKALWQGINEIPDGEIWKVHNILKGRLFDLIMERAQQRWVDGDVTAQQIVAMGALLNPRVLTIGFARRFAEYKRPGLILQDREALLKIINNPWRPVQIIFAGKSHPADYGGKSLLQRIAVTAQDRAFQGRIAFVENYDMHLARFLTHGVDIWLNNPYRLQEASGTSGMKAAINGVPNLSVRDGWWEEGYNGSNGWAIGAGPEAAFSPQQNANDVRSLYSIIENEIVPLYYEQDSEGVPHGWIKVVKESIGSAVPRFSACRMVREYTERFYVPALEAISRA